MTVCGVGISDGWLATIVVGGSLVLMLLILAGVAEWSTRRYMRNPYRDAEHRAERWRPRSEREDLSDD